MEVVFPKNVLTFPAHRTTWECGISRDHPEDKGTGETPGGRVLRDEPGASAVLGLQ